jgi:hypothetical protein
MLPIGQSLKTITRLKVRRRTTSINVTPRTGKKKGDPVIAKSVIDGPPAHVPSRQQTRSQTVRLAPKCPLHALPQTTAHQTG